MKKPCARSDCTSGKMPKWMPVLLLHPPKWKYPHAKPAVFILGVKICEDCKATHAAVADWVHPTEGWRAIESVFFLTHKVMPDRASTTVDFIRTDSPEAQRFFSMKGN